MGDGSKSSGPSQALKGAYSALYLLLLIGIVNYVDRQLLGAVVPSIRREFFPGGHLPDDPFVQWLAGGLSWLTGGANPVNSLIGLLGVACMVTYMLFTPVFGILPIRKWLIVAFGVTVWSLATGLSGMAGSFFFLLICRCLVGTGEASFGPLAPPILKAMFPEKVQTSMLARLFLAIPVGSALGIILGGVIAESVLGWRWAFYLCSLPGFILAGFCLKRPDPEELGGKMAVKKKVGWRTYLEVIQVPSYRLTTIGMTTMCFAVGGIAFWMPSYIAETRGAGNPALVNMLFGAILLVTGIFGTLTGGLLCDRLRQSYPKTDLIVPVIAMAIGCPTALLTLVLPFPWAWISLFFCCFVLCMNTAPLNAAVMSAHPQRMQPAAMALNILVIHLFGDVFSPLFIGVIGDLAGMQVAFVLLSIVVMIGAALLFWASFYLPGDVARAKAQDRLDETAVESKGTATANANGATKST